MKTMLIAAAAAALLAPGLAGAQDLSGTWKLDLDIADMMFHATCQMSQMGGTLTGSCLAADPGAPPAALTGTVDGTSAKFAYDVNYQGSPLHLTYTGTVRSDTAMDGTIDAQIAQGTFKGAKQAPANAGASSSSP